MDPAQIRLVALDMDGTVTQHRTPLEAANRQALDSIARRWRLVFIGAGSCARIHRQLGFYPTDIIGNYGMEEGFYDHAAKELRVRKGEPVSPAARDEVLARAASLRERFGFESYAGDSVEFHASGMLTFALLGTKADIADKLAFDPDRAKRRPMLAGVKQAFPEYTVFLGGSSSFDIVPRPYNKLYALTRYLKAVGIAEDQVVFFGDDFGPGGNDEQVYTSDIAFVPVDDYRNFPFIAGKALDIT